MYINLEKNFALGVGCIEFESSDKSFFSVKRF